MLSRHVWLWQAVLDPASRLTRALEMVRTGQMALTHVKTAIAPAHGTHTHPDPTALSHLRSDLSRELRAKPMWL